MAQQGELELADLPEPFVWRCRAVGEQVVVSYGAKVLAVYDRSDRGLRNLTVVALREAGVPGRQVAALFGIRPEHVSRLRRAGNKGGSAALVPAMGRSAVRRAYQMADSGESAEQIGAALGVSRDTIYRCCAADR